MKIKLSKSQWNEIGEKTGWIKTAQVVSSGPHLTNKDLINKAYDFMVSAEKIYYWQAKMI